MENIQSLTENLENILVLYKDYCKVADEKNRALVDIDFSKMDEFLKKEQEIAHKISKLERERVSFFESFPKIDGEKITLRELIESHIDEVDGQKLKNMRDELLEITSKVSEINDRNMALTKKSLEVVDYTLKTITDFSSSSDASMYNGRGLGQEYNEQLSGFSLVDVKI